MVGGIEGESGGLAEEGTPLAPQPLPRMQLVALTLAR